MVVNLPASSTVFVGRDGELAEIKRLFSDPACRLLTLVGPGGIGKTRLAIESARQCVLSKAVHFVPLQPLTSPDFIIPAIADALNYQFFQGSDPKQQLLEYLREKSWLLVLDNFEHLLDRAALLSEILAYAPGGRMLVTSRERLNLVEEWVLEVGGLAYPSSENAPDLEHYSAVELFLHHARRVHGGFTLTARHKPSVSRVCRLLGGMPLGIELAAAWVRALSCEEIARELEHSLDILETSARNVEPRHRNIRVALDPTLARLSDEERAVFERLSVFRGGFTREAAEYVAGASLHTLSGLVDKSLLRVDTDGCYDIHELLRQYAEEQLKASGESEAARDAHSAYYAGLLHRLAADLKGPNQVRALDEIEAELDNVRVGWRWAVAQGRENDILQSLDGLHRFYQMRSRYQEGAEAFGIAANRISGVENALLGQLLTLEGWFRLELGHTDKDLEPFQKGMSILHQLGMYIAIAMPMRMLMYFVDKFGGYSAIQKFYRDHLTTARNRGDGWGAAWALQCMGELAYRSGKFLEAQPFYQESLASFRTLGDRWGSSWQISGLGLVAQGLNNYKEARQYHLEHLALCKDTGDIVGIFYALEQLGVVAHALGERETSRWYFGECIKLVREIGWPGPVWDILYSAARGWIEAEGQPEQAVELYALVLRSSYRDRASHEAILRRLETLKAELPPEVFAAAVQRGEASGCVIVVTALLEQFTALDEQKEAAAPVEVSHAQVQDHPLTERELEILRLIADGYSNGEIADQLVLAISTVKWYVNQIFSKLHATSRTQAVARARTLGLLM